MLTELTCIDVEGCKDGDNLGEAEDEGKERCHSRTVETRLLPTRPCLVYFW
jgi:hypothetical protein